MGFFERASGTTPAPAGTAALDAKPDTGASGLQGASDVGSSAQGGAGSGAQSGGSLRDMRAQAVHRLQVGLVGLATMLLLIGLANIIMDRAKLSDKAAEGTQAAVAAASSASPGSSAKDPLADMGVAPQLPVIEAPESAPQPVDSATSGAGN